MDWFAGAKFIFTPIVAGLFLKLGKISPQLISREFMDANNQAAVSKGSWWAGCVMSALPVAMLLMSGVMKLMQTPQVVEGLSKGGYPPNTPVALGIVELACTIIYLIPRTSVLGAILLTGYLGGAVDANLRSDPRTIAIPVVFGVLVWGGLYLRDPRIKALIPLRS
jgi:hypothetical protein